MPCQTMPSAVDSYLAETAAARPACELGLCVMPRFPQIAHPLIETLPGWFPVRHSAKGREPSPWRTSLESVAPDDSQLLDEELNPLGMDANAAADALGLSGPGKVWFLTWSSHREQAIAADGLEQLSDVLRLLATEMSEEALDGVSDRASGLEMGAAALRDASETILSAGITDFLSASLDSS